MQPIKSTNPNFDPEMSEELKYKKAVLLLSILFIFMGIT